MINKINKKYKKILLTFVLIFVIMITILKAFADDNLNTRTVHYTIGSSVNYSFDFFTDCIKFHTKASGYEKYKGMDTESNMNSMIGIDRAKMQGYGNYEFKPETNLFSFIDYCYSKEPTTVMDCAYRAGATEATTYDYPVLLSYRDRQINTDYFKYFWQNMNSLCTNFKDYQDDFFFLKYTYPATQKIGINLAMLRNAYNDEESIKEYLTCLTSYIFSITPQAQVENMTFGKGDVVPFLYYKDKKHANIDVRKDSEALMDIAKYAYVALIEGWCTLPTPYHLWENEYNFLFGTYDHNDLDYDLETLHEWYDETYQKYCKDKGKKGNNLLGSDINHIIESDYSIEQQLEATEYYLKQVFNELGINSDFKETMARNELMAKYMMQNSNLDETIKDYNVTIKFMTENLQRGTHEEQNTHTVVTSDFQTLEFDYKMNERFIKHSDEDILSDGAELGNEKWINITEFAKKTYEDAKLKGEPHKATFEAQVEDIIEKNGAYTDFNGNKVYGSVKWDDDRKKVLYRVYDYKSNPMLNDTDFDGLWDNADSKPLDNKFKGTSTDIGKVEYNQDFRWFYTNNKKYNDEVAVMSLIMSNLADGNTVSIDQASGDITTYLRNIGFTNPQNIGEYGDNIYIAKKTVQYYDQKKDVIGVFLGKCDRWYSDVIKYKENQKSQNVNTAYKESLEHYIIRIINKVNTLNSSNSCYWVAGYDVGGSIASELASKLVESGKEVYAYTFGAFNTRDGMDTKTEIKNIRNEDDFAVKYITGTKPGQNYGASIFEDLMHQYRALTGSSDYEGNYIFTNFLLKVYDETEFLQVNEVSEADRIVSNYFMTFNQVTNKNDIENYADLIILLNKWKRGNSQAHSIKSYYVLAKSLNGFDLLDGDGEKQEHYQKIDETMVVAFNKSEINFTDDQLSDCDGYPFNDLLDIEIKYDYENEDRHRECKKITDYLYTYYTINDKDAVERNINFVKFWNAADDDKPKHANDKIESLYEYKAGSILGSDIGNGKIGQTKITTSGYYKGKDDRGKSKYVTKYIDKYIELRDKYKTEHKNDNSEYIKGIFSNSGGKIGNNSNVVEIFGRIIAAFPSALFSEQDSSFYNSTNDMHLISSYMNKSNDAIYNSYKIIAKDEDIFKLVDVVMEYYSDDEEQRYQFVVPFVVVDPKNLHIDYYDKPSGYKTGKFSNLTDNRYGQVEEYYDYQEKQSLNNFVKDSKGNKYLDKDAARSCAYISPIEPYIRMNDDIGILQKNLLKILCGWCDDDDIKNYRIVSMRLYKSKYAVAKFCGYKKNDNGTDDKDNPIYSANWDVWYNINKKIPDMGIKNNKHEDIKKEKEKLREKIVVYE